jgi:hypothetical protein
MTTISLEWTRGMRVTNIGRVEPILDASYMLVGDTISIIPSGTGLKYNT